MVTLQKINEDNFSKVVDMKLSPEQNRFVAPNIVSLAQAWLYYQTARPLAICDGDEVVGFVMLSWDEDERTVSLWRLMIAPEHQRKGYGRKAVEAVIQLVRESDAIDLLYLDYVEGNSVARELYYSLGFRENGKVEDGEIIMTLPMTDKPKVGVITADKEDIDEIIALLEKEKAAGDLPEAFADDAGVKEAVANGALKRLTIMGETIGVAVGATLLIAHESLRYLDEARERLRA